MNFLKPIFLCFLATGCKAKLQESDPMMAVSKEGVAFYQGQATTFENFSERGGGCGVTEEIVMMEAGPYAPYAALRVPASGQEDASTFNNGKNCGRWIEVKVDIDGVQKNAFFLAADSCTDPGHCQKPYHLDLSIYQVAFKFFNRPDFKRQDFKLGSGWKGVDFKTRKIEWRFIPAPSHNGGPPFIHWAMESGLYYPAIIISNLVDGLGGLEFQAQDGSWARAVMEGRNGQKFRLGGGHAQKTPYRIRFWRFGKAAFDAKDPDKFYSQVYEFDFPCADLRGSPHSDARCTKVTQAKVRVSQI